MASRDTLRTLTAYNQIINNPLACLRDTDLQVNGLPAVADGTERTLFFAYRNNAIVIDQNQNTAAAYVGGHDDNGDVDPTFTIQRHMVISAMRGHALPVGALAGQRHEATTRVDGTGVVSDLWVTEMQNGCTVLILDWGNHDYSMFHLQPSDDNQFNAVGKKIIGAGKYSRAAYKNAWLKSEANTVVTNSANGDTPQRYIMIQSNFENVSGWVTQVIGVRDDVDFTFFRQRARGNNRLAQRLDWTTWRWWKPWSSY